MTVASGSKEPCRRSRISSSTVASIPRASTDRTRSVQPYNRDIRAVVLNSCGIISWYWYRDLCIRYSFVLRLDDVCVEVIQLMISPSRAIAATQQVRDHVLRKADSRANYQLPSPPLSLQDGITHDASIETVRIVALVLVSQARHRLTLTAFTASTMSENASLLRSVQYSPVTMQEQWMTITWALFLTIPFQRVDFERVSALQLLKYFCMRLKLSSWTQCQFFLRRYYFSSWLLVEPCQLLWLEMMESP